MTSITSLISETTELAQTETETKCQNRSGALHGCSAKAAGQPPKNRTSEGGGGCPVRQTREHRMQHETSMLSQLPVLVFKVLTVNSKHNKIHNVSTNHRHCTLVSSSFQIRGGKGETIQGGLESFMDVPTV